VIRKLEIADSSSLLEIYNEMMIEDPDFRPISLEEFKMKFLDLPYPTISLVAENNGRIEGCLIADIDPLVMEKFHKKIAIIDLLLAREKNFQNTINELLFKLENILRIYKVLEIQLFFVAENMEKFHEVLYLNGFNVSRVWYYMERDSSPIHIEELPTGFKWDYIRFRGRYANAKKWIECHNEAFRNHYGMRPLRYEELKSYMFEESFDPTGYFGIYEINKKRFVAQCSCEIDNKLNEYKRISKGVIWTVGVIDEMRGKGFGKMLVKKAINWLYEKGVKRASIHVDSQNEIAYNLYSSLGFEVLRKRLFFSKIIENSS